MKEIFETAQGTVKYERGLNGCAGYTNWHSLLSATTEAAPADYKIGNEHTSAEFTKVLNYIKEHIGSAYTLINRAAIVTKPRKTAPRVRHRYSAGRDTEKFPVAFNYTVETGHFTLDSSVGPFSVKLLIGTSNNGKKLENLYLQTDPALVASLYSHGFAEHGIWNVHRDTSLWVADIIRITDDNGNVKLNQLFYLFHNAKEINDRWNDISKRKELKDKITKGGRLARLKKLQAELDIKDIDKVTYNDEGYRLWGIPGLPDDLVVRLDIDSKDNSVNVFWKRHQVCTSFDIDILRDLIKTIVQIENKLK